MKELVVVGSIRAYEVRDAELGLYCRALKAGETREVPISLTAEIPGNYTATASRNLMRSTPMSKNVGQAGHSSEIVAR